MCPSMTLTTTSLPAIQMSSLSLSSIDSDNNTTSASSASATTMSSKMMKKSKCALDKAIRLNNQGASLLVSSLDESTNEEASRLFHSAIKQLVKLAASLDEQEQEQEQEQASITSEDEDLGFSYSSSPTLVDNDNEDSYYNQAIFLRQQDDQKITKSTASSVQFVMVMLLWNSALAHYQRAKAIIKTTADDDKQANKKVQGLLKKSSQLYLKVVEQCTSHSSTLTTPKAFDVLVVAAKNNAGLIASSSNSTQTQPSNPPLQNNTANAASPSSRQKQLENIYNQLEEPHRAHLQQEQQEQPLLGPRAA